LIMGYQPRATAIACTVLGEDYNVKGGKKVPTARDRDRLRGTVLEGLDWSMPATVAREWLRDFDAELLRLYDRLQQAASPDTPSTAANEPVRAWRWSPSGDRAIR
jgi:hypothetical protein